MSENKFKPKPGQTDYTNLRKAPVINCVIKHQDKILIVQRSSKMIFYPDYWNGVSGFIDDSLSIKAKIKQEVKEEVDIEPEDIINISEGQIFEQEEPKYNKTWVVHPFLVEVKTNRIHLDWEAQDYKWLKPEEIKSFKLIPGFDKVLQKLFNNENK